MTDQLLSVWLDTITVEACWPVVAAFDRVRLGQV
jgi:hypothetical protein